MTESARQLKSIAFKRGDITSAGTFSGYGSTFGGKPDAYGDVIAPGAFKASLAEWQKRGRLPPMLLQHGGFLGAAEDGIPVGVWTSMVEDSHGLKVDGELFATDTQKGRYIHEGLKSGALDGLSIGFIAREVAYGTKPDEPRRTLKRLDLLEVSIVTFPANPTARVQSAKSLKHPGELEDLLRGIGFSQREAKRLVAGGWKALTHDTSPEIADAVALLADSTAALTQLTRG